MSRALKGAVVGVCAVVVSTVAIQASDVFRGIESSMSGLVSDGVGPCGEGAILMQLQGVSLCVDAFESSPGVSCPESMTISPLDTAANLKDSACAPVSVVGASPWRFVSLTQAQQLCARSEKRLPSNAEWYRVALTLQDDATCVSATEEAQPTGSTQCHTMNGVYDMVGNVWEWVDESVTDGQYRGRTLPETGFVSVVDNDGIVSETSPDPVSEFGKDYAWTGLVGTFGMIRGGFYDGEDDAGIFAQNLTVPFDLRTAGVGFRCVRDL